MNPKYYVTPTEMQKVADFLIKHQVGGGLKGIVLPNFVGPVAVPQVAGKDLVYVEFENGAQMNAGLVLDLMSKGYQEWFVAATLRNLAIPEPQPKDD